MSAEQQGLIQIFVKALCESVEEALKGPEISSRLIKMEMSPQAIPVDISIASTLSLISTKYIGTIHLFFPKDTFLKYYEKLLGETPTEIDNDVADAASEMLNILYGLTKKKVNEAGGDFAPAIPTSFFGDNINLLQTNYKSLYFHYGSDVGEFYMVLSVNKAEGKKAA